jgi:hypothetical protein
MTINQKYRPSMRNDAVDSEKQYKLKTNTLGLLEKDNLSYPVETFLNAALYAYLVDSLLTSYGR